MANSTPSQADLQQRIDQVLDESVPLTHPSAGPARDYLAKQLGHELTKYPVDLRYRPALPYFRTTKVKLQSIHPAMLARVRDIDGQIVTIQRIYLTPSGELAATHGNHKIMRPAMPDRLVGASIQLFQPDDELFITDSIEEALRLHIEMGVPAWATISRWASGRAVVPSGVDKVMLVLRGSK